jgi:predicted nucleic acid-binding protein
LLRALAHDEKGAATWSDHADALKKAARVVVPALVLAEVDWFLRKQRPAMRKLVGEILDPATTYELEPVLPGDVVRALELDAAFPELEIGLVDGMVAAVAERRAIHSVLTTDRRDFTALRIGPRLERALKLVP